MSCDRRTGCASMPRGSRKRRGHNEQCIVAVLLTLSLLLTGCSKEKSLEQKQYEATFLALFDTVTTVVGYAASEEEFRLQAQRIQEELQRYHRLFDIYEEYEGLNNLKTVNDNAGIAAVEVDDEIIAFLQDCRSIYELTGGKMNAAMGSVLRLWHEARNLGIETPEKAALPDSERLKNAAKHIAFDAVRIDEKAKTVYITDPEQSLDVGAIAKGWATERVCRAVPSGMIISVGGNVCATGPRPTDGSAWIVAVQDPKGNKETPLHTLYLTKGCIVSSGDYQRYYTVDGRSYHHIIDPDTAYPATYWRMVTVLGEDSGFADALSTALFTMPLEEGRALAEHCGAEVMWMQADGSTHYTAGFRRRIRT